MAFEIAIFRMNMGILFLDFVIDHFDSITQDTHTHTTFHIQMKKTEMSQSFIETYLVLTQIVRNSIAKTEQR